MSAREASWSIRGLSEESIPAGPQSPPATKMDELLTLLKPRAREAGVAGFEESMAGQAEERGPGEGPMSPSDVGFILLDENHALRR